MSAGTLGLLGADLDLPIDGVRLRPPRPGWRTRAACSDVAEAPFAAAGVLDREAEQTFRDLCGSCGVREECLAFALAHGIRHGIWGGFNHDERRHLRRRWLELRDAETAGRHPAAVR